MAQTFSYGWVQPLVTQLCKTDPFNIQFCLESDLATQQYVALAARGFERRAHSLELRELAHVVGRRSRRQVLAQLWAQDPGNVSFLQKLPRRVLARSFYDELIVVMTDIQKRNAVRHSCQLTPRIVAAVALEITDLVPEADAELLTKFGSPVVLRYIIEGIQKLRPDLGRSALLQGLRKLKDETELEGWISKLTERVELPTPPWDGSELIVPVRTVRELRALGRRFQNCLASYGWKQALSGEKAFYHCQGRAPALACLARQQLLGQWRLDEIRGPNNAALRTRVYTDAFAAAGFPVLSDDLVCALS